MAPGSLTETDWLGVFHDVSGRIREAVLPLAGSERGRREIERGAGGDVTVEVDRLAEAAAVEVLQEVAAGGAKFSLLSEELGVRDFGAEYPRVVLDPVDGSLNAKQGIPVFATMLALAIGPTLAEIAVGHVVNLVSGQRWDAVRGAGAFLDEKRLSVLASGPVERIECLGLESSPRSLAIAAALVERASKIRILGSMALSLCHTASGGLDLFCCPIRGRAFDMSASLLVLHEAGGVATDLSGNSVDATCVDLGCRTTLLAASNADVHRRGLELVRQVAGTRS